MSHHPVAAETPAEHIRNALQLLLGARCDGTCDRGTLDAVAERLRLALHELEREAA